MTYILASSLLAEHRVRVLKHEGAFAVFDRYGEVYSWEEGEEGIYRDGTRFINLLEFRFGKQRPLLLNSTISDRNVQLAVDLTNPLLRGIRGKEIPKGSVHAFRSLFIDNNSCYERLRLANFARENFLFPIEYRVAADFKDIFEVRGYSRQRRGKLLPPEWRGSSLLISYLGLDGIHRTTRFAFDVGGCQFERKADGVLEIEVPLGREPVELFFCYDLVVGEVPLDCKPRDRHETVLEVRERETTETLKKFCQISGSNEQFNQWIFRSQADLEMLISNTPDGPYPYAGVPWFSATFGRDGILTALQTLWVAPEIAKGVLHFLAANQAKELSPEQDAEPGKILHEARSGEMANLNEIPFRRYYGSVDATPLFIILAGEYLQATGDLNFIRSIWGNIEAALNWIRDYGDSDGDGFVEYARRSSTGLVSQAWKDSQDSVFHQDGTDAEAPIAICEVQGYVYMAKKHAAQIARALRNKKRSEELADEAEVLKELFHDAFWCEEIGTYALALDKNKEPCKVRSSNVGHCLYTGIVKSQVAERVCDTLMNQNSFCGWGVRTIPLGEARYNPMSYHNGSVWPHDCSLIAMGLARYGQKQHAATLFSGMFSASRYFEHFRLPELFCGFDKRKGQGPTLYPLSCAPQAWAAGSVFLFLQACLGIKVSAIENAVMFSSPVLPDWLNRVSLKGVKVGNNACADIEIIRYEKDVAIHVLECHGGVKIHTVR